MRLLALAAFEEGRTPLEFLMLANVGLLHLRYSSLGCLRVEISIYDPLPPRFVLGEGNGAKRSFVQIGVQGPFDFDVLWVLIRPDDQVLPRFRLD